MKLLVGARASSLAIASLLLAAGCMSGEGTGNRTDLAGTGDNSGSDNGSNASSALTVTTLASDQGSAGASLSSALINPWGVVSFQGMFWVANEATGKVSIFDGAGKAATGKVASDMLDLGEGITGVAVNIAAKDNMFQIHTDTAVCPPAMLIFASNKGKLIGVNTDLSTTRGFDLVDRSGSEASYLGVAVVQGARAPMILAADFHNGRVDVFDTTFHLMSDVQFVNDSIPANFAPFNVMSFNDMVFVAYAQQDDMKEEEVAGPGLGFVSAFDVSGKLLFTVKSDLFNAPWGMAIAGKDFGAFAGALLVGNFGDGHITAIDLTSMKVLGQLMIACSGPMPSAAVGASGCTGASASTAIAIDGLWGIAFGDGVANASAGLYFAAGPEDEMHGMFGVIGAPATTK